MNEANDRQQVAKFDLSTRLNLDSHFTLAPEGASCCRGTYSIPITPHDVVELANGLGSSTGRLVRHGLYITKEGAFLKRDLQGTCILYRDGDCSVAEKRPLACRIYPLIRLTLPGDREWFVNSQPAEEESGSDIRVSDFLESRQAMNWIEGAKHYSDLFAELTMIDNHSTDIAKQGATSELLTDVSRFLALILDSDLLIDSHGGNTREISAYLEALRALLAGRLDTNQLLKVIEQQQIQLGPTGCAWPAMTPSSSEDFPPLPGARGPLIRRLLAQLNRTHTLPAGTLLEQQFQQINQLVHHFGETSPWYRQRLLEEGIDPQGRVLPEQFHRLPVLTRENFQQAGELLYSTQVPFDHGPIVSFTTSGSTGKPVTIRCTALSDAVHWAAFIRNDQWHHRNFDKKFAWIQAYRDAGYARYPEGERLSSWNEAFTTGELVKLNVMTASLEQQLEWLLREQPAYLMSFPSNLEALARLCVARSVTMPWLEGISTIGEHLSSIQCRAMGQAWQIPVRETYGCAEATYIGFQSSASRELLVQSESVYLELLDDENRPCKPGQPGWVVVTTLHNFATPVIRYKVGDLAVWSNPQPSTGLPVLERVLGRARNAMRLPNGEKAFPLRWSADMVQLAPVRQWQMIQRSFHEIEVRLVVERPLSPAEERGLLDEFDRILDGEFSLKPVYVSEIPRSPGGKFEEFRCEVD